ncbi:HDIG domain-containing metalloprotein [Deinococcus fonticola]|uniref:HDIG domain-containing metalloprotein n=1 Tax=Deinococcus fonticola TaxID=2528713 RepID=UPI001074CD89|nr:HDIG domain-containing metalloprotein [Deinococcus fonticola]
MFRRPALPPFPAGGLLVGGAARDVLRGVTPRDFDWAVPDPRNAAQVLAAQRQGSAFPLDLQRGYWRVHLAEGEQHDFVPLPADVTADLLRRDFTLNALALTGDGRLLDPAGGQRDLKARRLRMVSASNLRADPLRAWRAARFATTLNFTLELETERVVRQVAQEVAAGTLPMPAWERVRDEMQALLAHQDAAPGVQRLEGLGLLALTLPELREGQGVGHGGFHHLDVYAHNLEALHQLLARTPDAPLPLRWATLLHDVGKPRTQARDPDTGRLTFHGHDKVGAAMTGAMLERLKLSSADTRHAAKLVAAHMVPLPATPQEARRFVHRRRDLLPDLLRLMLADREAARGPQSTPASRHAYALGLERVLEALEEQPERSPPPLLSGSEIMALLHLPPGPRVGVAARQLAEAAALREVTTPDEARAYLLAWQSVDTG